MNIDKLYELAELLQKENNDTDLEMLDAELNGSKIEVTYDNGIIKQYSYSEQQYDKYIRQ